MDNLRKGSGTTSLPLSRSSKFVGPCLCTTVDSVLNWFSMHLRSEDWDNQVRIDVYDSLIWLIQSWLTFSVFLVSLLGQIFYGLPKAFGIKTGSLQTKSQCPPKPLALNPQNLRWQEFLPITVEGVVCNIMVIGIMWALDF